MNMHTLPRPATGPPSLLDTTRNVKLWSLDRVISMARLGHPASRTELHLRAALGNTLARLELRYGSAAASGPANTDKNNAIVI